MSDNYEVCAFEATKPLDNTQEAHGYNFLNIDTNYSYIISKYDTRVQWLTCVILSTILRDYVHFVLLIPTAQLCH